MEMLILLLVLSTLDKDADVTGKLRSALQFYRENRELVNMLRGAMDRDQTAQPTPHEEHGEKKASRPSEEKVDSMKILEEYLKRTATV